ncbi:MAG: Gfo/Idh/MocA family oxidoreductase [Fuerstiella sp.]
MTSQRRTFLKQVSAGTVALAATTATTSTTAAARTSNADQVVLGIIGPGGMGSNHVRHLARRDDVEIAWVCDVDSVRAGKAAEIVTDEKKKRPEITADMRHVLDDDRVDAVFIATPDHWHAPASLLALDAGKHVYVEKPCCHNIHEGRLMADAVQRTGKCLQVGTQSRSTEFIEEAMQRLHEGEIGEILVAKAWNSQRRGSIGKQKPSNPPAHLDFENWVGPAPMVPYQSNLLHGIWRWWYDFGCGDIGNDGVHDIDVALWGLGVTDHPVRASCFGSKLFFDDDQQFPDTQYAVFDYAADAAGGKPRQMIFEQRIWSPYTLEGYENGEAFYGTEGCMVMGHSKGWRLYGPRDKLIEERVGQVNLVAHHSNFLDCVRGKATKLNADITAGRLSATLVHLANISARTGRVLNFNPKSEQIIGDEESNAMVARRYRDHWATPAT